MIQVVGFDDYWGWDYWGLQFYGFNTPINLNIRSTLLNLVFFYMLAFAGVYGFFKLKRKKRF